jgi:hypothetical protein
VAILDIPVPFVALPSVRGSIWENLLSTSTYLDPDTDDLYSKFAIRSGQGKEDIEGIWARNKRSTRATWTSFPAALKLAFSPTGAEFLHGARKHEVESGLQAISMSAEEAAAAIYNSNDRVCRKRIKVLEFIFPTPEESEFIRKAAANTDPKSLSAASRFHFLVSQEVTPSFADRLDCISHMCSFDPILDSLRQEFSTLSDAIDQVRESGALRDIFAIILEFVNFLNARDHSPQYGFTLTFLSQLQGIKTSERGVSLLDCIVAHISKHYSHLLRFSSSLSKLPQAIETDLEMIEHKFASLNAACTFVDSIVMTDTHSHVADRTNSPSKDNSDSSSEEVSENPCKVSSPDSELEFNSRELSPSSYAPHKIGIAFNHAFDGPIPRQVHKWISKAKEDIRIIKELRENLLSASSELCRWLCSDVPSQIHSSSESIAPPQSLLSAMESLKLISTFVNTFNQSVDALTLAAHESLLDSKRFVVNLKEEEERQEKEKIIKFMRQFMLESGSNTEINLNMNGKITLAATKRQSLPVPSSTRVSLAQATSHPAFSRSRISVRRLPFSAHFTYSSIS